MDLDKENNLKLHYFQHVAFEGLGIIKKWAEQNNATISSTKFYENSAMPDIDKIDLLVIMGGPMGIYDYQEYPWLKEEKKYIEKAIKSNKKVIGICLGAQLIADVLGAKVYKNKYKEIGWFPIEKKINKNNSIIEVFPDRITAFHWHGDTFDIPKGAAHFIKSEACQNQAFLYKNNVLGLQFHLESTNESINQIIENCKNEIHEDKYINSIGKIKAGSKKNIPSNNELMLKILEYIKLL